MTTTLLYKIALADPGKPCNIMGLIVGPPGPLAPNRLTAVWNRRITAIAGVVATTGQDPADYHLIRHPELCNNMALMLTPADMDAALQKLQDWWALHGSDYPAAPAVVTSASTP